MAKFTAIVKAADRGGHIVPVPDDAATTIGVKYMMPVRCKVAGKSVGNEVASFIKPALEER